MEEESADEVVEELALQRSAVVNVDSPRRLLRFDDQSSSCHHHARVNGVSKITTIDDLTASSINGQLTSSDGGADAVDKTDENTSKMFLSYERFRSDLS